VECRLAAVRDSLVSDWACEIVHDGFPHTYIEFLENIFCYSFRFTLIDSTLPRYDAFVDYIHIYLDKV
jgi:hypothetical protein